MTVGDQVIDVSEAIRHLELLWEDPTISSRIVSEALLAREVRRQNTVVTDADVDAYVELFVGPSACTRPPRSKRGWPNTKCPRPASKP